MVFSYYSNRSGSPQPRRISARAWSRSFTAAFQSVPSGMRGAPMEMEARPGRGTFWPSRRIERMPRIVTGRSGTPACAATRKPPSLKGRRPGAR